MRLLTEQLRQLRRDYKIPTRGLQRRARDVRRVANAWMRSARNAAKDVVRPVLKKGRRIRARAADRAYQTRGLMRGRIRRGRAPNVTWKRELLDFAVFGWWPASMRRAIGPIIGWQQKEPGVSYAKSFQHWSGRPALRMLEWRSVRRKRWLLRRYRRLSRPVDLSVPYVYVALHFQPERTTSALGGAFANQLLMVDLIARTVPPGWRVYVKEHPSQFYPKFAGERGRFPGYYEGLARIPGVHLVPLTLSPFDLIDGARAVATVTGSSGWEALARGVPVLLFGFGAWYKDVEGAFYVPTEAACRAAFDRLRNGYTIDETQLRRFMRAVDRVAVRADMGYRTPDELESGIGHDESVNALTGALKRWGARSANRDRYQAQ